MEEQERIPHSPDWEKELDKIVKDAATNPAKADIQELNLLLEEQKRREKDDHSRDWRGWREWDRMRARGGFESVDVKYPYP